LVNVMGISIKPTTLKFASHTQRFAYYASLNGSVVTSVWRLRPQRSCMISPAALAAWPR
jgi:hypothetical protein